MVAEEANRAEGVGGVGDGGGGSSCVSPLLPVSVLERGQDCMDRKHDSGCFRRGDLRDHSAGDVRLDSWHTAVQQ